MSCESSNATQKSARDMSGPGLAETERSGMSVACVLEIWSMGAVSNRGLGAVAGRRKLKKSFGTLKLIVGVFDADGADCVPFRSASRRWINGAVSDRRFDDSPSNSLWLGGFSIVVIGGLAASAAAHTDICR